MVHFILQAHVAYHQQRAVILTLVLRKCCMPTEL